MVLWYSSLVALLPSVSCHRSAAGADPSAHLHKSNVVLRTYSAEQLKVLGEMPVHVQYGGQKQDLSLLIVQGDGPTLLGRSWLEKIRLNWAQIAYHSVPNQVSPVSGLQ